MVKILEKFSETGDVHVSKTFNDDRKTEFQKRKLDVVPTINDLDCYLPHFHMDTGEKRDKLDEGEHNPRMNEETDTDQTQGATIISILTSAIDLSRSDLCLP